MGLAIAMSHIFFAAPCLNHQEARPSPAGPEAGDDGAACSAPKHKKTMARPLFGCASALAMQRTQNEGGCLTACSSSRGGAKRKEMVTGPPRRPPWCAWECLSLWVILGALSCTPGRAPSARLSAVLKLAWLTNNARTFYAQPSLTYAGGAARWQSHGQSSRSPQRSLRLHKT